MKIAILTHPLRVNYGGLLQAYALKKILENEGHDVFHLQLESYKYSRKYLIIIYLKAILKYIIGRINGNYKIFYTLVPISEQKMNLIRKYTTQFHEKLNIKYYKSFEPTLNTEYDAFIVGSDQIWRPGFTPNIYNYYLDFVDEKVRKKIAYAASLGVEYWPYNELETKKIKELIEKFSFISVRELKARNLYKEHISMEFPVVLDPTLLLKAEDYKALFLENSNNANNYIAVYILNEDKEKEIISQIEQYNTVEIKSLMPRNRIKYNKEEITEKDIYMSPEHWLKIIYNAKYIITDSFHGTVFSILFNKQFIVLTNDLGGNSRINSLLQLFNLSNRFVTIDNINNVFDKIDQKIEYNSINKEIELLRKESLDMLKKALK